MSHGVRRRGRSYPHPAGPVGPMLGPPWDMTSQCPPRRHMARINLILLKLSQNGQVSSKYVEKASHSPCFHFGLQKSPLEFPRFPFCSAFSHKELMGQKRPYTGVYVKTTKCHQMYTHMYTRKGRPDTPTDPQQAAPGSAPHLGSARLVGARGRGMA